MDQERKPEYCCVCQDCGNDMCHVDDGVQSVLAREVVLQDSKLLVAFNSETGALTRLIDKTNNWTIEGRPNLGISFRMLVPLPDRQDNFILGQKQHPGVISSITNAVPQNREIVGEAVDLEFSTCHFLFVHPRSTVNLVPVVIQYYTGDWHSGVDIYKKWRATWYREPRVPGWEKDVNSWQQLHDAIEKIQAMGVKMVLFGKFPWADMTTEWYKKDLYKYEAEDPYGIPYVKRGYPYLTPLQLADINDHPFAAIDFLDPAYRAIAVQQFKKVLALCAAGFLYDEVPTHSHVKYNFAPGTDIIRPVTFTRATSLSP